MWNNLGWFEKKNYWILICLAPINQKVGKPSYMYVTYVAPYTCALRWDGGETTYISIGEESKRSGLKHFHFKFWKVWWKMLKFLFSPELLMMIIIIFQIDSCLALIIHLPNDQKSSFRINIHYLIWGLEMVMMTNEGDHNFGCNFSCCYKFLENSTTSFPFNLTHFTFVFHFACEM